MNVRRILFAPALLLWMALSLHAGPLNLTPAPGSPNVGAAFVDVSYDAALAQLLVQGYVTDYSFGSVTLSGLGTLTITATITGAGVLTDGSLSIQGDAGNGAETLLTGSLATGPDGTAFGSLEPLSGSTFEFLFQVTGGNAGMVQDFGGIGSTRGGVALDAWFENGGVPFDGSWTQSFHNDGASGLAEAFVVVPEPVYLLPWCVLLAWGCHCGLLKRS
jgi:hypothetical protein